MDCSRRDARQLQFADSEPNYDYAVKNAQRGRVKSKIDAVKCWQTCEPEGVNMLKQ